MDLTIVDRLYDDNRLLIEYLDKQGESSLRSNADNHFRKILLLSAASYFEANLKESLVHFFEEQLAHKELVIRFLQNKAIERQYHTYFSWGKRNANTFFGLFGDGFKEFMSESVKSDLQLNSAIEAFMELGEIRNHLVHQNFAVYPIEKTSDEIYELYRRAVNFIRIFPMKLREYAQRNLSE